MQRVRCEDCRAVYDYDEDGFCPRCGAFNQPKRTSQINVRGETKPTDEAEGRRHLNSFVHRELHTESRERRRSGLDRSVPRWKPERAGVKLPRSQSQGDAQGERAKASAGAALLKWIVYIGVISAFARFFLS
jgi:hypothetical protein